MAVINKTGITNGTTIQAEHVTRAIDALSGGSTDTVIASGSFSGSLTGNATTATTATNATNTAVTNTSTGTGPYYITFVESATGNVGQRVDATGLTYNATTDTITATASFATTALSASYASNVPVTASYALAALSSSYAVTASFATTALSASYAANVPLTASYALSALSSSYAVTASFALNAGGGGGGGGIFALTGSKYATTNNLEITGSLQVTAGVTASLQGTASFAVSASRAVTASFADLSRQVLVQRTAADADYFMVIVDSGNSTPTAESLNTVTNIRVNPGSDTISAVTVSGSFSITGSLKATKFSTVDLRVLGDNTASGQFAIPIQQTGATPLAGSIYWNDATEVLYIYSATNNRWNSVQLNP